VAHAQSPTSLDYPGSTTTEPTGINNSGQIVGNYYNGAYHGFLYKGGAFSTFDAPGYVAGTTIMDVRGISDSGQIVGTLFNPSVSPNGTGFLYSGGTFTSITFPGAGFTYPLGISSNGAYLVGVYGGAHNHGFLYTGGVFTTIDYPGATDTVPYGINNNGTIVGTYDDGAGNVHSFLDNGGVLTSLNAPGCTSTFARGINDSGIIVGNCVNGTTGSHGFLYNGGVSTALNFSNAGFEGINDNGAIVGQYGTGHGFLYAGGVQGYINPKYMIVDVTYAPPGSQSSVTYTNSLLVGNSTTIKSSFTDQTSLSVSVSVVGKIPGFADGKLTGSFTDAYGQTSSSSNMVTINKTTQVSDKPRGRRIHSPA